jgi:phage tail-like protein
MPNTGVRIDPVPGYIFYVEIEGVVEATFTQCSGLESEIQVEELQEGGVNDYVHQLPGRVSHSNLTLSYGSAGSEALWAWYEQVAHGQIVRKNVSVLVYDYAGVEVRRWNLREAYPVKWEGPTLNAAQNESAVESITLAHHGLERAR